MQKVERCGLPILGIDKVEQRVQHSDAELPAGQEWRVGRRRRSKLRRGGGKSNRRGGVLQEETHELLGCFQNFDGDGP